MENTQNAQKMMKLMGVIVHGFDYDPGHSDLDNEQPITVRMTLGDYRLASLLYTGPGDPFWCYTCDRPTFDCACEAAR